MLTFLPWNHDWNFKFYAGHRVETAVDLLHETGVGFVRMDFLWDDIEPRQGQFTFDKYDRLVDLLARRNIKILGLLSYNPAWAGQWNAAPDKELLVNYARAVVRRYKHQVMYWEIWNEPDDSQYWKAQDGMKAYTALLKDAYTALKAEDPSCRVLMGGVSQSIAVSLKNIYRNGGRDFFDIVNVHPFVDPKASNAAESFRGIFKGVYKVMENYGDAQKDIWITEIGCPGLADSAQGTAGWWLGPAPSEGEQAEWVKAVFTEALRLKGVKKVFWAFFQDTPNYFQNAVDYFGLIRRDFSRKPAYDTYKKLIQTDSRRYL